MSREPTTRKSILRVPSSLPEALEGVVTLRHRRHHRRPPAPWPGLSESQDEGALITELLVAQLTVERQRTVTVICRGKPLRPRRIDLIV